MAISFFVKGICTYDFDVEYIYVFTGKYKLLRMTSAGMTPKFALLMSAFVCSSSLTVQVVIIAKTYRSFSGTPTGTIK